MVSLDKGINPSSHKQTQKIKLATEKKALKKWHLIGIPNIISRVMTGTTNWFYAD